MNESKLFSLEKRSDGMFVVRFQDRQLELKFIGDSKFVSKFTDFAKECTGYTRKDKGTRRARLRVTDDLFDALVASASQSKDFRLETRIQRLPKMTDEECIAVGINPEFQVEFGMAVPLNPRTFKWGWAFIRKNSYENENHLEIAIKMHEAEKERVWNEFYGGRRNRRG